MKEQIRLNTLKKIENKISEEIEKPSYRDCLISALCTKKFTVETARMINERGILLCGTGIGMSIVAYKTKGIKIN